MWTAVIIYRTYNGKDYHRYRIENLNDLSDLVARGANRHAIESVRLEPEFSDISIYADNDKSVPPCWDSPAPFVLSRPKSEPPQSDPKPRVLLKEAC